MRIVPYVYFDLLLSHGTVPLASCLQANPDTCGVHLTMSPVFAVCLVLLLSAAVVLPCQPPDCDHPDCGTCGNACCALEFKFALSAVDTQSMIQKNLKTGGDDGRYTFINSSDLRPHKIKSGAQFLMQAEHTTLTHHYIDTLNFLLLSNSTSETIVHAFSVSRIYGAFCDLGQNYKNLVGFIKGLDVNYDQKFAFGCKKDF